MPVGGSFIQERWCWSKIIVWKNSRWRRYLLLSYNHSLQSFIGGLSNSNDANFPALDIWWNNALRDTAGKITAIPFVTCLPGKRHPSRETYLIPSRWLSELEEPVRAITAAFNLHRIHCTPPHAHLSSWQSWPAIPINTFFRSGLPSPQRRFGQRPGQPEIPCGGPWSTSVLPIHTPSHPRLPYSRISAALSCWHRSLGLIPDCDNA